MLKTLFYMALSASLAGTLTAGGILLLKALLPGRLSPRVGRGLWLAALLLFLLPIRQLLPQPPPVVNTTPVEAGTVVTASNTVMDAGELPVRVTPKPASRFVLPQASSLARNALRLPWEFLWLGGIAVFFCIKGAGVVRLRRLLGRCRPFDDCSALQRAQEAARCMAPVRVLVCDGLRTPLTFGILRPVILLPQPTPQGNRLHMALLHELIHIRQRDLPLKLLALFVEGLHWFNPLAHLMTADLDAACEMLCDHGVVQAIGDGGKKDYCSLLIDTATSPPAAGVALSAGLGMRGKTLKRRISAIMDCHRFRPVSGAVVTGLVLCLCLLSVACSPEVDTISPASQEPPTSSTAPDTASVQTDNTTASKPPADIVAQGDAFHLTCTKTEEWHEDEGDIPHIVSSTSMPLPEWMEDAELGYAQIKESSADGFTLTTYVLEQAPEGAAVPDWYENEVRFVRGNTNYLQWPCPGAEISIGFEGYEGHIGTDFAAAKGSDVLAAAAGMVTRSKEGASGYGKYIILDHSDGRQTLYAHLDELLVEEGQAVERGDVIAKSGDSGNTGAPNLHFELRENGRYLAPCFVQKNSETK